MNQGVLITIGIILITFAFMLWYSLRERYEFQIKCHGQKKFVVWMRLGPFGKWEIESTHSTWHHADFRVDELEKHYNRRC